MIATCLRRLKAVEKGVVKPLVLPQQILTPQKPTVVEGAYIMCRKEAFNYGTVVTATLFLNFELFSILFDSGATSLLYPLELHCF